MGRISEKSPLYRTKQEILEDIAFVLACGNLRFGTKFAVVDQIIWVWSEFDGKHKGCRYWSEKAIATGSKREGLVHEHVVPRKIIRAKLFALRSPRHHLHRNCLPALFPADPGHRGDLRAHGDFPDSRLRDFVGQPLPR